MLSHQLGFISSWKMLRRDRGWIKPLLVIALVSWIPIVGQVVILGYGLEWARLTAWGVDAAPKQRNVDIKKMLSTGAIAFLIALIVNIALGGIGVLIANIVYQGGSISVGLGDLVIGGLLFTVVGTFFDGHLPLMLFIILFIVNVVVEALVLAAQMRATLYDGFGAGWRFDRIIQMVGRDSIGFVHTALIAALSSTVSAVLSKLVSAAATALVITALDMRMSFSMMSPFMQSGWFASSGILPFLIILLFALVVLFVFQVVKVILQLVSINSMGQWFQRFDVGRWGVSSDPLPVGVPHGSDGEVRDREPFGSDSSASAASPAGQVAEGTDRMSANPSETDAEQGRDQRQDDGEDIAEHGAEAAAGPILLGPITDDQQGA